MINSETAQAVTQGSVATVAVAILKEAAVRMIPYSFAAIPLLALDCLYGSRAARLRGERVTLSKGFRMSLNKVFSYICWLILAPTLTIAFEKEWIEWAVLGGVFFNEGISIVGNYLETKGLHLSLVNLYRWLFKKGAEKAGVDVSDEEAGSIITGKKLNPVEQKLKECGVVTEEEEAIANETQG